MKIVIAPDSFKESLTALEVANAIEQGFKQVFPNASYIKVPVADGGEGTVQAMVDATQGELVSCQVHAPLGNIVTAQYGLLGGGEVAVIEMAAASGLHLVPIEQRNPMQTCSFGTGELILDALDRGVKKIVIGLGGSATNDGGMGMLCALGMGFLNEADEPVARGGQGLGEIQQINVSALDPRLASVDIEVACDVDNPLCGPLGASAVFGPQKGADAAMVTALDANLAHYADCIKQALGKDVADIKGAGAAGGMGAGVLAFFNAKLRPGIDIVMETVGLAQQVEGADLVITGEGRIDSQTIQGKTPMGVTRVANLHGCPVIGIAGCVSEDYGVVHQHGLVAVFPAVPRAMSLAQALASGALNISNTSRNIAMTLKLGQQLKPS
ncbi:glycerate kinase [Motilimonas sp. E26]|uniref:glycerate kinase n=1 Tax=Motilimonas sp. E26 TaxID=2865674 RepID=UPI001E4E247F|nr:glycerate kinase [Motilimonas sp. E26]MCE0556339.1 glycerate kinase [Motilimonas sp. E26]